MDTGKTPPARVTDGRYPDQDSPACLEWSVDTGKAPPARVTDGRYPDQDSPTRLEWRKVRRVSGRAIALHQMWSAARGATDRSYGPWTSIMTALKSLSVGLFVLLEGS